MCHGQRCISWGCFCQRQEMDAARRNTSDEGFEVPVLLLKSKAESCHSQLGQAVSCEAGMGVRGKSLIFHPLLGCLPLDGLCLKPGGCLHKSTTTDNYPTGQGTKHRWLQSASPSAQHHERSVSRTVAVCKARSLPKDEYTVKCDRAFQPTDGSNLRARDTCSQASEKSVLEDDLFRLEEELECLEVNAAESHLQSASSCLLALLHIQAHVSQLEGQVRTLEMEQAQLRQLLQLLQQQHQEDLDLIACAHRSHMKVVEKNNGQQEERLQQEEQPAAQLPLQRQDTAPAQQHPMSQEHEKRPMSQKPDKQLKELQDRLSQQQTDMAKERSQFQEVIAKLEARLSEQTQVLEQERGKAMVEEAKAKSLQCSLEKQQQFMKQQLSMEREELKRVKNTLLEEQKSMLQKCSEERGKLEAEWAEFHTQEKLREEWLEQKREQSRQIDRTRMRLAKEQEELSFQGHRLRAKEEQLERDKEQLNESWHELQLEKEKVNSITQTIQKQKKEIKSMIQRSSQKYRVGKRALREAHRIESLQQDRLQAMQRQLEQLRQHQELLHQDWLSTIQQRRQLEQLCNSAQNLRAPMESTPCRIHPQHGLWYCRDSTDSSTALYATLQMLRQRAQMELDFLEGERVFLESLKKAPNSA
ncbi:fas-binding factor 1 isoform X5 [Pipra filicauda]|uniref:Fas-binding factor 1 isoform X5 n=1 Tax=Pipra filicauda TaxID=649802 RepID=A0A7R5KLK9_9PASS|nr:fas-binding factor 1 isoform X5 [Pipra filicauda]